MIEDYIYYYNNIYLIESETIILNEDPVLDLITN